MPVSSLLGHELLKVLPPTPGGFYRLCFLKAYQLSSFLHKVAHLVVWAFGCYCMLITLPLISKNKTKTVKVVLELFKLAKQSCNM